MPGAAIVTGGAGFIGSHLVDALLAEGAGVTVVDDLSSGERRRVAAAAELCELDIVDGPALAEAVREVGPEAVYHLAAQASVTESVRRPERDLEVNVLGTLNVLRAAEQVGAPVIFTSTGGALYGDEAPRPTPESCAPQPLSPYGTSKLAAEGYVRTWAIAGGAAHAICRLGNVYGPRQNPHGEAGVVAIFSSYIHEGRPPTIYGHGRPTRDYVYVGDVVRALTAAAVARRAGIYNVATGVETSVEALWRGLSGHAGSDVRPQLADLRPGELQHSCLSIERAERELGWRPQTAVAEGLRRTYDALVEEFESQSSDARSL